jgi:hypothetical protein
LHAPKKGLDPGNAVTEALGSNISTEPACCDFGNC